MSAKQFESFLVDQFLAPEIQALIAGFRYQFQSPDIKNSIRLHNAFIANADSEIQLHNVKIDALTINNTKLLPVLHSDNGNGYSENFISHLRDEVAGQQGDFKGTALLIIHNSMLDTIINSAEDVSGLGAIWHPEKIKQALHLLIDETDDASQVSKCLLDLRFNQIVEDGATMFGFDKLYNALLDGDLKFFELDMLDDPAMVELSKNGKPAQISARLERNKSLFDTLDNITHHFPNELTDKLAEHHFSETFVKENFAGDDPDRWKTELSYSACLQEQMHNKTNLLELEKETLTQGELIAKSRGEKGTAARERHLIVLLEPEQTTFEIELVFIGGKVEAKQCKLQHNKFGKVDINSPSNAGGKRSKFSVTGEYKNQAMFFSVELKRDITAEKYKFRVLVIRQGDFYVDAFKHCFLLVPNNKPENCRVILQTEDSTFQISELPGLSTLSDNGEVFDNSAVGHVDFEKVANESDMLHFSVKGGDTSLTFNVEGAVATDALSLPLILDTDRFVRLYQDDYFGVFNRAKNKVLLDNKEFAPKARRLTLLQREAQLVDMQILTKVEQLENSVTVQQLEAIDAALYCAYRDLFEYCSVNKTLPSISGWGEEFRAFVQDVVSSYEQYLSTIGTDVLLSKEQKTVVNIGFCNYDGHECLSPFHPLVLAYYLSLTEQIVADESGSFKTLPPVTLARLNPQGLLPFVYHPLHQFSYTQLDKDNSFWLQLVPKQDTSYDYVRKLVKEKVGEFKEAFTALFTAGPRSTLIINSVNNHSNHELFMGLVDYVKSEKENVCKIHVNLYDDKQIHSEFDSFSEAASYDEIKETYELNKGKAKEQADMIIDLLRTRLTFSKFKNKLGDAQAYAHLSFFRNNNEVETSAVNIDKELSGVVCNGLLAGEAAAIQQDKYFTGFGLNKVNTDNKLHLTIAKQLGGLIEPARSSTTKYNGSNGLALAVSDNFKILLDESYKSSIWTTIIDPKVTLEFFESSKDVVLIHYSDNYTNSANYDAITVTKETQLYKAVLEEEGGLIEEFNAFNGDWLLKMISASTNERKEKRGIIGAYKFVNCLLSQSDITWVPLSVAEMIRVAGNIGLKMTDSDFSRNVNGYKSGLISDDVLFVGFKDRELYILPLEVKAGLKQTHKKGVEQAKELKRYLTEDILGRDDLAGHLYRGLFIRQILMQVDKYKLYNLYPKDYFKPLLNDREWWLQGEYPIATIADYPAGFLVSVVENDTFLEPEFEMVDEILKIQFPVSYLPKFLNTPLQEMMYDVQPEKLCHVPEQYILKPNATANSTTVIKPTEAVTSSKPAQAPTHSAVDDAQDVPTAPQQAQSTDTLKVLIGHDIRNEAPILWEPTNTAKFMNTNSGIIGTMGTGKTQCTKSVVTQLYRNQHNNVDGKAIGILIFDYKSDYVDDKFMQVTNGKKFNLHKLPYNPLSLFGDTPMLPVHTARGFSETMGKAFGLGQKQQLRLRKLISEAYELAGIHKSDKSTWSKPAPTIADVWALFEESDPTEDSLYAALESLYELEIFEDNIAMCTSLYELVDGVTVIELAGYPGEIQNLVVALTLDLFYSQMQKQGKPQVHGDFRQVTKLLLVDEADNFMSQNFPSLRKVLKEGREYGVGVILSTQDITHFKTSENDYSAYILSWIVHRVGQIKNQDIKSIFNKDDKADQDQLMKTIRELDKHYSLYVDGDKKITKIKDKAFWELLNDT